MVYKGLVWSNFPVCSLNTPPHTHTQDIKENDMKDKIIMYLWYKEHNFTGKLVGLTLLSSCIYELYIHEGHVLFLLHVAVDSDP